MKITKEIIEQRERKLEETRKYLKTQFVGINDIIDKFVNSVRIWYLLPEIQSRPLIVNLWGITGVGKTDLVRKFVNYIEFSDRFCEIQLDSKDGSATVQDYLEMIFEDGDQQGILLLDEMQRFRTVDEEGKENNSSKYQDLWMLLSDGTFQSNSQLKNDLVRMILEDDYWADRYEQDKDDDDDDDTTEGDTPIGKKKKQKPRMYKYKTGYWEASRIKKLLKTDESIKEIMEKWDHETKIQRVKEKLMSKEVFEGTKYTRLLIIVSGNLDEAFHMAADVEDADQDADVYHEFSKTINIIQIKGALKRRFKPEQIARLGNIHLIYPILNKAGYYNIIKQKSASILGRVKVMHKIDVTLDNSVYDVIYSNGVFPTQGVRPLLSTISSILENALPTFIFEQIRTKSRKSIRLTHVDGFLQTKIGKNVIKHEIPRVLDDIKTEQTINHRALIAVHEAGHAVLYALLFKAAPTQIVVSTTNYESDGFVGMHNNHGTLNDKLNRIQVTFGGRVAEVAVFGDTMVTGGAASDYMHATSIASSMIRKIGMGRTKGVYSAPANNKDWQLHNVDTTDEAIELILHEQYKNAEKVLDDNMDLFLAVVDVLMVRNSIVPTEFKKIADKYIKGGIAIKPAKETVEAEFSKKLIEFKNKKQK